MSGLAWLNELMTWLGRWFPRITLIRATHEGVLFGPGGSVTLRKPGLMVYWPITHELHLVSTRLRTTELAAQLHGREAVQVVVGWRITDPATAMMALNDIAANLDDRIQAALANAYESGRTSGDIAKAMLAILQPEMAPAGLRIESVDVSQRGPVFSLKMLNDWAQHESGKLA